MSWPPPQPALVAPRFRYWLTRLFGWADRRRARKIGQAWQMQQDLAWRDRYADWWMNIGWLQGADNPDVAYLKLRATR